MFSIPNLLLSLALVGVVGAEQTAEIAQPKTETEQLAEDLKLVQGAWEIVEQPDQEGAAPTRTALKEITGNIERVTRYDAEGKVTWVHEVEFRLDRGPGPVRVFTFSNVKFLEGRLQGKTSSATTSYVYQVNQDMFVEAWGLLAGDTERPAEITRWTRVKEEAE